MRQPELLNEVELSGVPTSASLRRLLLRILKIDAELDAFCLDFFPLVYAQFTDGMLRTRKLNLLLDHAGCAAVFVQVTKSYPEALATYKTELQFTQDPIPVYRTD